MRIGFVVWSLLHTQGGIERLGVDLAHAMRDRGHEPVIFYNDLRPKTSDPVYALDPQIKTINLALHDDSSIAHARAKLMESKVDVVCAMFSWNALLWFPVIMNNTGIPLLISEHNTPAIIETERWNRHERIACMAGADAIHLLNKKFAASLPDFLIDRVTVISNPAPPAKVVDWDRENTPRKRLIAAGRFVDDMKQFSLLIQAFALLAPTLPDWDLCLCGDGGDRPAYEALTANLGLKDRITFPGMVDNIDEYYASSHLFCIPSRYEGFGLVVVEAQSHALPVVCFSECEVMHELITHGENGLLAPEMTPQSLAAGLRPLMKSASLRKRMGQRGQEMLTRFAATTVFDSWERLLVATARAKNNTKLMFKKPLPEEIAAIHLQEILSRPHPFVRLGSEGLYREIERQTNSILLAGKHIEELQKRIDSQPSTSESLS